MPTQTVKRTEVKRAFSTCVRSALSLGSSSKFIAFVCCIAFVIFGLCVPVKKHAHTDGDLVHLHSHTHSHGDGKPHTHVHRSKSVASTEINAPVPHIHFSFFGFEFSLQIASDNSLASHQDDTDNSASKRPISASASGVVTPEVTSLPNTQIQTFKTFFYASDFPNSEFEIGSFTLHALAMSYLERFPDRPPVPPPRTIEVV